jgi:hypothetical protein
MARHRGPLLVDTNVILECWRVKAWRALAGGYGVETVETVEDCVIETQTGYQRRRAEQRIGLGALQTSLAAVHKVADAARAAAVLRDPLWAHALARADTWVLCGLDKASLRFGVRVGLRDRLVSLEDLLHDVGHRPGTLRANYTSGWLLRTLAELVITEGSRRP